MSSRQQKKRGYGYRGHAWQHKEFRGKVTLADFYAARLNAIEIPWGSFDAARLMGAPLDMPRASAKALAPYSQKTLDKKTKPLLSGSSVFKPQTESARHKAPGRNWFGFTAAERRHLIKMEKATGYFDNRETTA